MATIVLRIRWRESTERVKIPLPLRTGSFELTSDEVWLDEERTVVEYRMPAIITRQPSGGWRIRLTYSPADSSGISSDLGIDWGDSIISIDKGLSKAKARWISNDQRPEYSGPAIRCEVLPLELDIDRDRETVARLKRQQARFKARLLEEVGHRCEMTGEAPKDLLEAAHVCPAYGAKNDEPENGILLRFDLHRLFDLQYFSLLSDGTIVLAEKSAELPRSLRETIQNSDIKRSTLLRIQTALARRK